MTRGPQERSDGVWRVRGAHRVSGETIRLQKARGSCPRAARLGCRMRGCHHAATIRFRTRVSRIVHGDPMLMLRCGTQRQGSCHPRSVSLSGVCGPMQELLCARRAVAAQPRFQNDYRPSPESRRGIIVRLTVSARGSLYRPVRKLVLPTGARQKRIRRTETMRTVLAAVIISPFPLGLARAEDPSPANTSRQRSGPA